MFHLASSISCASSASRRMLAVAPTTLADGAAERKAARACPARSMWAPSRSRGGRRLSANTDSRRIMLFSACGLKVGDALTMNPPRRRHRLRSSASTWAEI